MKTVYDVAQLLKKYGIFVYLGKREWDIEMMEYELTELFKHKLLDREVYARARSILKVELDKEKAKIECRLGDM
ncbi:YqgQ family protein [Listeria booriae]|uniref:YqgQ family protein n=1 Tax=Listeria booriae TaxID=1552123 RepID=A0A7X0XFR3_9LIST|nr:YqgQ family protein [Listeria booriae]MBC1493405.1 YqgQ family protein [Listeria booriae]